MTKVLILDNYDSFTYNLFHQVRELAGNEVTVCRNDEISLEEVEEFDFILLSPGPGLPRDAGIMPDLIKKYASTKKILGVCLGHQAIAEAFGATLSNSDVFHGVSTSVYFENSEGLFTGMSNPFEAGRYHSWMVDRKDLPAELMVTAWDKNEHIMAIAHRTFALKGVQFHPESIMTPEGKRILSNWIGNSIIKDKKLPI